jgi:very-short-patch-repair endonuclease
MSKKSKIKLAREFRKNPTKSERLLWEKLRKKGFLNLKFRRQHLMEGYIVDFYCKELKLVLEVDGEIHNYTKKEDEERQKIIERKGDIFYRINSFDIENNIDNVLYNLKAFINKNA